MRLSTAVVITCIMHAGRILGTEPEKNTDYVDVALQVQIAQPSLANCSYMPITRDSQNR